MNKPIPGAIALALVTGAIPVPSHACVPPAAQAQPEPRQITETPEGFVITTRHVEAPASKPAPELIRIGATWHLDAKMLDCCCGKENADAWH